MSQTGKGVNDIYNVIGGVGRVVYADSGEPYPTDLSDILNTSTGVLASGWNDFGATDGGFKIAVSYEKTEWEVDQENSPIDEFLTRWNYRLETTLVEVSLENLKVICEGTAITTDAGQTPDERTISFGSPGAVTERLMAYLHDKRPYAADGVGKIRAYVFRKARYGGNESSHEFIKGEKAKIPVTFTLFPDTTLADSSNMMYIIDQMNT